MKGVGGFLQSSRKMRYGPMLNAIYPGQQQNLDPSSLKKPGMSDIYLIYIMYLLNKYECIRAAVVKVTVSNHKGTCTFVLVILNTENLFFSNSQLPI